MKLEDETLDSEVPKEVKNMQSDNKKYVILKNHVKEINISTEEFPSLTEASETMILSRKQARKLKKMKQKETNGSAAFKKVNSEVEHQPSSSSISSNLPSNTNTINPSDVEELRSMYNKCKKMLMKMESRYGNLLDLNRNDFISERKSPRLENSDDSCQCAVNKKILFDDDGKQLEAETDKSAHICPTKLKRDYSEVCSNTNYNSIKIQYGEARPLPHDLRELSALLRDETIELTLRNEIIAKIKAIRQAHLNELRFERPALIEKLKQGSKDVFEFKGSNILSIPGYPK